MTSATQSTGSTNRSDKLATPGRMVSVARESRGISQADLAQRLRLDTKFIRHLELDNFEQLPGPTFVKGYLRSIANELGLETEPMLEAYKSFANEQDEPTLSDFESRPPPQASSNSFLVRVGSYALGISSLLLIIFWWQSNNLQTKENNDINDAEASTAHTNTPLPYEFTQIVHSDSPFFRSQQPEGLAQMSEQNSAEDNELVNNDTLVINSSEENAASKNPATDDVTSNAFKLSLRTTAESWVEIYDSDSKRLYFGMANTRAPIEVSSDKPLNLLIGNTPTVTLTINGKNIDLQPLSNDGVAKFTFP